MSDKNEPVETGETAEAPAPVRIEKRDFIREMAAEADLPLNVAGVAYEAFVKVLLLNIQNGNQVNLTGFGRFYRQRHAAHPSHYAATRSVDPYMKLKFSSARNVNKFMNSDPDEAGEMRVPGTRMNPPVLSAATRASLASLDLPDIDEGE
ncbi:MAG TPA: HU family DNA-binding protein [Candidatus Lumbricidophila sp.]|nr:HU family DNA-binding protein [Candidatus Lumbricidophila sp.]